MRQVFTFDVECPAETPASAPIEVATKVPAGSPASVRIVIPDGHAGLTGITLAVAHQPVIPFQERLVVSEPFDYLEGNDETPDYDLEGYPDSGAWSAFLYNTDTNAHSWQIRYVIGEPPQLREGAAALQPLPATMGVEPITLGEAPSGSPSEAPPGAEGPGAGETPGQPPAPPETPAEPSAPPTAPEAPPEAPAEPSAPEEPAAPPSPPEGEAQPPPSPEGEGEGEPQITGERAQPPSGGVHPRGHPRPPRTRVLVSHEDRPAGGWLPHGARFTRRQTDQGQDFITNWRGWVIAPASGHVVHILADKAFPSGFGPHYAVVHIDSGPFGGRDWYLGHTTAHVREGERFIQGHHLATADQGLREGGGWVELGEAPGGYPGPMGGGARIAHLFGPLHITRRTVIHPAPPKRHVGLHAPAPGRKLHPAPAHGRGAPAAGHVPPARRGAPPHARTAGHPAAGVPPGNRPGPPRPAPRPPPPRPAPRPPPPPPRPRPAPRPPPPRRGRR